MANYQEPVKEIQERLRLRTKVIGYKRLEKKADLEKIGGDIITDLPGWSTFCQVPFYARVLGATVSVTRDVNMSARCQRIFGLRELNEASMAREAKKLAGAWFGSVEDALKQQKDYARIPVGEAIVVGPLETAAWEPDVVLAYGNPAQMVLILCALQKVKYEPFNFSFIGEGACSDSLARCYVTGKPAVSLACFGERAIGQVADDEMVVALPPNELERVVTGLRNLENTPNKIGYPVPFIGGVSSFEPIERNIYKEFADDWLK